MWNIAEPSTSIVAPGSSISGVFASVICGATSVVDTDADAVYGVDTGAWFPMRPAPSR